MSATDSFYYLLNITCILLKYPEIKKNIEEVNNLRMPIKKSINNIFSNISNVSSDKFIIPRKRKNFFELTPQEKGNIKRKILNFFKSNVEMNQLMEDHGFLINSVQCVKFDNTDSDCQKDIELIILNKTYKQISLEKENNYKNICEAKDEIFMSDDSYTYFRNKTPYVIHYVRLARNELNKKLPQLEENIHGVYVNAKEKIEMILSYKIIT